MINYLCEKLELPQEAIETFEKALGKISGDEAVAAMLSEAEVDYLYGDGDKHSALLDVISERTGLHIYTVHMAFLLHCAIPLKNRYLEDGIPEDIYYDTMRDLRYKLDECKKLYDIWGTFVFGWFRRFYLLERFKLGRLQYERIPFPYTEYKDVLKEGDTVYNCHIPSSGSLTADSVIDSLKQAYSFFGGELKNGIMPVYCSSWMLYPPTAALYPEASNMRNFYEIFDVIDTVEKPDNPDFWRIFYKNFSPEILNSIEPTTSLQRAFAGYLRAGNSMGSGKGVFLFDGERIID